jgi:mRNA interferase YafQ
LNLIKDVIVLLIKTGNLPENYKPHPLRGKYKGDWEAHIEPDWLIIWRKEDYDNELYDGTITFVRTGTHSDLFK